MIEIELLEGEEICPKCKGKGETYNHHTDWAVKWRTCDRCWGAGKLDWIEMAMGKPLPQYYGSSSSCSSSVSSSTVATKLQGAYNDAKRLHTSRFRNSCNDFRQFHVGKKGSMERQLYPRRSGEFSVKNDHGVSTFLRAKLS